MMKSVVYQRSSITFDVADWNADFTLKEEGIKVLLDEVNLIGADKQTFLPISIVDFVPRLYAALRVMNVYGHAVAEMHDYGHEVLLKGNEKQVLLLCTFNENMVHLIKYEMLRSTLFSFASQIEACIHAQHGGALGFNAEWWNMVHGGPIPLLLEQSMIRPSWFEKYNLFQ